MEGNKLKTTDEHVNISSNLAGLSDIIFLTEDDYVKLGGETEAGTIQRDVVRAGVVTISVSFSVTQKWLRLLTGYKQQEKIRVRFFDPETASVRQTEMYVGICIYRW